MRELPAAEAGSNWVMSELLRELPAEDERSIAEAPITPPDWPALLALIEDGTISGKSPRRYSRRCSPRAKSHRDRAPEGLTQVAERGGA